MTKVLAVIRTAFLVFIIGYTVRAMPLFTTVAKTFDEQYARCSMSLSLLIRAAWVAIGWIAFETAIGWVIAARARRAASRRVEPPPPQP